MRTAPHPREIATGIRISARIHALRRVAALTSETFIAAQRRTGLSAAEVGARLVAILDEQSRRDPAK
jgi:hypothetical protein